MMHQRASPATIAKAARLVVVKRKDDAFDVAGDHGTYHVRDGRCNCQAARSGSCCSHALAVKFYLTISFEPERVQRQSFRK